MSSPARSSARLSAVARFAALALTASALAPDFTVAQSTAVIQGVVADEITGLVIPSASVSIVDTDRETTTTPDGVFAFRGVAAGRFSVRVRAPGYATVVEIVDVAPGGSVFVQVGMPSVAMILNGILVVAPPASEKRPEARTAADLVALQVPGLMANSGIIGLSSNPVLLRGVNSMTLSSEAAIFLDGVRLRGGRGQAMDALSKIPASDVKSIRIIRGPAAALVDGSANGVVYVETRAGPGS